MQDKIKINGKVAKFPRNSRTDHALKMLESIKVNPKKIWYIMIESQDDTLKMVKYNQLNGVNLYEYTKTLKEHYMQEYSEHPTIQEQISKIEVVGENVFSIIKNIPTNIILEDGRTLLFKIANDLMTILND